MSSTNRKNASKRHVSDYYVTPLQPIRDFFLEWTKDMDSEENDFISVAQQSKNIFFLDPCAGGDVYHDMSYPKVINELFLSDGAGVIDTIDIRCDSLAKTKGDFLNMKFNHEYEIVITNPPFKIAQQIIQKSFDVVQKGGYVIMLLRLNFLGSQSRKSFWQKYPPNYIYVHRKRMSFTDSNKTDSIEYAHFVWRKGDKQEFAKIKII